MNNHNCENDLIVSTIPTTEVGKTNNIVEIIELYKKESERLISGGNYMKLSSGMLVNLQNTNCKGGCFIDKGIPIVCGKLEFCNNFNRASALLGAIKHHEYKEINGEM